MFGPSTTSGDPLNAQGVDDPVEASGGALAPLGRRAFIAGAAGAAAAAAVLPQVAEAAVPSGASYYQSVGPVRVADTRTYAPYTNADKNFQRVSDRVIRIDIRGRADVPSDAVAVVVSIAAIYTTQGGWVHGVPAGNTSNVANVNLEHGDGAVANMATVRLASNGKIDIRGSYPYDVIVDVLGVYRSTAVKVKAGRMKFVTTKRMLSDTRVNGRRQSVRITNVPHTAQAVVVNLAAAGARRGGYFTAVATGTATIPNVSNLNYSVNETRSAGAIVKLGTDSGGYPSIDVYSEGDAQMYVDVSGYITGTGDIADDEGLFVPINPFRIMDTRRPADVALTGKSRLWPRWTRAFELPENVNGFKLRTQMSGVAMNVALVSAMNYGYATVLPARTPRAEVSNLNVTRLGHTVANHVITRASTKGVEIYAYCGGDLVVDVAGWYTGSPQSHSQSTPTDPEPPQAGFPWLLTQSQQMGLQNWVYPHLTNPYAVVDQGNSWHWTNTGNVADTVGRVITFGHRVSMGAPYRNQHGLVPGSVLTIDTLDQRRYTYRYIGETITDNGDGDTISAAVDQLRAGRDRTFSLVSCTGKGSYIRNDQPLGGIIFRLVSTFEFVSWKDTAPRGNW